MAEFIIGAGTKGANAPAAAGATGVGAAVLIKDSDTKNFANDVLTASREVPVIVDFWAPWCGPCKQLGPALEKAVREAGGTVKLVKIDIDKNPQLAQQMRIQSIPAVFAFANGQPVDGFIGALPDSEVKAFVKRLSGDTGPSPLEEVMAQAKAALESGDFATAANMFGQILKNEAANIEALAGLARCYVGHGDLELAKQTLAMVPPAQANHVAVAGAQAALSLAQEVGSVGNPLELQAKVAANPADHEARFNLALALIGSGDQAGAIDELLAIVRRSREWNEQAARKQLVKLFAVLGPTHELTMAGRRRLSSILFS
ncbi:MAG: thioredoxin [Alphaproteobacteria bacterium]|nr:thioredoxin [Alphaproteobacteria bacterium]